MKIALVGSAHPYKGGGARHTTELAHRLAAAGHDVIIESWRAQYPARLYPGQQTVDEPEGEPFPDTRRSLAWYRPDGWFAAGRRLRGADLVVFALLTPVQVPAYLVMLAGLGLGLGLGSRSRVVVICHNVLPHEHRPGDVALTKILLRRVGAVLVHSAQQAELARSLAPHARIAAAPMPPHLPRPQIDQFEPDGARTSAEDRGSMEERAPETGAQISPRHQTSAEAEADAEAGGGVRADAEPCRLLFFGIVRPYKGLDVLLRALARAPETVTLTVAGEFWGGTASTAKLIAELGIGNRVTLRPGYVPASEIPALFAAADALVLPYREATASQNALLAFAHGVPVITTTAGSLAEHVRDNVDGLTVAPGDTDGLLRALAAISKPGTLATLRAGVREPDAEDGWDTYLRTLELL